MLGALTRAGGKLAAAAMLSLSGRAPILTQIATIDSITPRAHGSNCSQMKDSCQRPRRL